MPKSETTPTDLDREASQQAALALVILIDWLNAEIPEMERHEATSLAADLLNALPAAFEDTPMMNQLKLRAERLFGVKTDA